MEWKEETEKVGHKDKIVKKKFKYISNNRILFCSKNEPELLISILMDLKIIKQKKEVTEERRA